MKIRTGNFSIPHPLILGFFEISVFEITRTNSISKYLMNL